jgi:AraC family transcriptional regulator, regulatory protein of adaptative response / DNA-3-methyladenine glycosylase II
VSGVAVVGLDGIYCRPGCDGGQPVPEDARPFPLAAAAEAAGYRACLCCRPYRSPQPVTLNAPEFVCRAVRLILDGALDGESEADLAARLGVSGRHLRRLFVTNLGITPNGLACSSRAHFARRLLEDTDLSVMEVAFASGFGSVRQFNRACKQVFGASPRQLRCRRRQGDLLVSDEGLLLRLPLAGGIDWDDMLAQLATHAIPGVEHVSDGVYRRTIENNGDAGALELFAGGRDCLLLRVHLREWNHLVHIVQRARHIANLDFPVEVAASALGSDPVVGSLIRAHPHVRPVGCWDPFEAGVHALIAQRASFAGATRFCERIVQRYGRQAPGLAALSLTHLFPRPSTLAAADLTTVGLPPTRAATIRAFAEAVAANQLILDRSLPADDLCASLRALPGADRSAAHLLAYRLGEPDAWPITDAQAKSALRGRIADSSPGAADLGSRTRPWRSLDAAHVLQGGRALTEATPPDVDRQRAATMRARRHSNTRNEPVSGRRSRSTTSSGRKQHVH